MCSAVAPNQGVLYILVIQGPDTPSGMLAFRGNVKTRWVGVLRLGSPVDMRCLGSVYGHYWSVWASHVHGITYVTNVLALATQCKDYRGG